MKLGNTGISGAQAVFLALGSLAIFFSLVPSASQQLFLVINQAGRLVPDTPLALVTDWGNGITAACIWLTILCFRPSILWKSLTAIAVAALLINAMKQGLDVMRPAAVLEHIRIVGAMRLNHSFPSAHTGTVFVLAGMAWTLCRRADVKALILLAAIMVGLSRITNGAHWPLDVVMGAWLGWGCARLAAHWVPECQLTAKHMLLVMSVFYGIVLISALQARVPFPNLPLVGVQLSLLSLLPLVGISRLYRQMRVQQTDAKSKVSLAG
ncbi:phosphatase PAP2 family protein [Shewanella litorisediminis]|uniref:Phosphatase PAP2 family protein n=1 Tax=Shewanella litorisediminis TaxID=1173586 RepID=A0ABX7G3W8_9GAMM|nr:phosphatase PAP2 family protein [Shewanella litorisediminis]MCL2919391.1 phosphatase PAP2 family protein [Shewanella litorisediminis]QRH01994.1 phosphatase PAP2 family protein [Shewanella litorisediminis]